MSKKSAESHGEIKLVSMDEFRASASELLERVREGLRLKIDMPDVGGAIILGNGGKKYGPSAREILEQEGLLDSPEPSTEEATPDTSWFA